MNHTYTKILISLLLAIIAIPALVLARAGGWNWWWDSDDSGSDWGSSDSSYSSSHSSSSSTPSIPCSVKYAGNQAAIDKCQSVPGPIMILLFFIAFMVIFYWKSKIWGNVSKKRTIIPTSFAVDDINEKMQYVHSKDPNWTEQKFKELVNVGFFKIQNAWCAGDMGPARAFISDGIMRRFTLQLEPYRAKNQHNVLERLSLDRVDILDITVDEKYIYMKTLINASCVDTVVDADDGSVSEIHNDGELEHWQEVWIWMRSNTVLTKDTESGVFADKCPNCGSVLQINSIGKCDYCGTEVTKWEFDWVLSEIIQVD